MRTNFTTCLFLVLYCLSLATLRAQNRVTYAGGAGNETFYDVTQLSDGTFLVAGSATSLAWANPSVSTTVLTATGINNASGTGVFGFILQLDGSLSQILRLVHFPQGAVEDIKFMKFTSRLGEPTGDLFISGTTKDSKANGGGYFIAKLNNNFVNGTPTALTWARSIWAEGDIQTAQPWDVGSDGKVIYVNGQYNGNDWSQLARLNTTGTEEVVENFTTHWKVGGGEYYGTASAYPSGGISGLTHSAIVLKVGNRCSLRSWTQADFDAIVADENGGTKKGKMPLDAFYNTPCTPSSGPTTGGGYTGYSINTQTFGGTCVTIDRRDNRFYLGMNIKSKLPDGNPDFEPTVIAFNTDGAIQWWSRLYHEITPTGQYRTSSPDQYVDALAIDYAADNLVVMARCHGNNTENFWEGNTIATNVSAAGFQNRFTGTNGDIHFQWLGKLRLTDGQLQRSTYMGEYVEGTTSYGAAHPDPNIDGFPNPNAGWPNINTTRIPKNTIRTTADGSICVIAEGRRTITTANAHQKMPLPLSGLTGSWNNFVRVYKPDLSVPLYSSLVVGQWDTATGVGGDNVELFGVWKTQSGVIAVGRATSGGNSIPTANVPNWGTTTENGTQSAVFAYLTATNLYNTADGTTVVLPVELLNFSGYIEEGQNVLKWTTASELNNAGFEVQKSTDGVQFDKIAFVIGYGTTLEQQYYEFLDKNVGKGVAYYRLKQTDFDGHFTYSDIVSVSRTMSNKNMLTISPNPLIGDILQVLTENPDRSFLLFDAFGRIVQEGTVIPQMIDLHSFPSGVYFLKVQHEVVKVIKN